MSFAVIVLTYLGATNPARLRLAVPQDDTTAAARWRPLALGSVVVLGLAGVAVAVSRPLLDWLQISPETFRLAAGLVFILVGAWWVVLPHPAREPELPGLGAALVPITFPLLINPALFVAVISTGADESAVTTIGSLAISLVALNLLGRIPTGDRSRSILAATARILGAALMVVAVVFIIDGIRDV